MAKRKRLMPANPSFAGAQPTTISARAPIADVARDAAGSAAYEELAQALNDARETGRMVVRVPLTAIDTEYLVRDRIAVDEDEMRALVTSIASRGQQAPIDLVELGGGRYGLISGWRRMHALARLHEETGDPRFAEVLGLIRRPAESADAYMAMVEENEIRVGLSYFERARIVLKAVEQGVFASDRAALQALFKSASRAKRSKIGGFLPIVRTFDGVLRFPSKVNERLGLQLGRMLNEQPEIGQMIQHALEEKAPSSSEEEVAVIEAVLSSVVEPQSAGSATDDTGAADPPVANKTARVSQRKAVENSNRVEVTTDLHLLETTDGRLILSGEKVGPELKGRLIDWLRQTV